MGATSNRNSLFREILGNRTVSILLVIALLVAGFLGWVYWNRFQRIFSLQAEVAELKAKREELRREISKLLEKRNRRNDLDYIEKLAKKELGLVYPPDKGSGNDN
ncbi:MAG: septum formation initiator family protein [Candidatus Bipolaricaulia bacterium]